MQATWTEIDLSLASPLLNCSPCPCGPSVQQFSPMRKPQKSHCCTIDKTESLFSFLIIHCLHCLSNLASPTPPLQPPATAPSRSHRTTQPTHSHSHTLTPPSSLSNNGTPYPQDPVDHNLSQPFSSNLQGGPQASPETLNLKKVQD